MYMYIYTCILNLLFLSRSKIIVRCQRFVLENGFCINRSLNRKVSRNSDALMLARQAAAGPRSSVMETRISSILSASLPHSRAPAFVCM